MQRSVCLAKHLQSNCFQKLNLPLFYSFLCITDGCSSFYLIMHAIITVRRSFCSLQLRFISVKLDLSQIPKKPSRKQKHNFSKNFIFRDCKKKTFLMSLVLFVVLHDQQDIQQRHYCGTRSVAYTSYARFRILSYIVL